MNEILSNEELRDLILSIESDAGTYRSTEAFDDSGIVEFICKVKAVIIAALNIAKIFVGRREKEILNQVIEALKAMCQKSRM